uniref:U2A'/phosphoprotein 32 family A C-terminal domain-containing protein n=1 Tax=Globisporangium ultimum (strain ATCC 200006 / CBS 805.95 / DAOM BR144) TaxID=431595 RepID=K3WS55_GLOUD
MASPSKAKTSAAHAVPLDYSFMGLTTLSEMAQHDPVGGKKKSHAQDAASGTAVSTSTGDGALSSDGKSTLQKAKGAGSSSLRVNNNKITSLDGMDDALSAVFDDPSALQWIDLSGNALAKIARDTFAPYKGIFTLHLHGNKLQRYADIDNLALCLPMLHSLTLHGNPLDQKKHYRNYVIASFPTLMQLDFSSVTKGDREKAETWASIYKHVASPKGRETLKKGDVFGGGDGANGQD